MTARKETSLDIVNGPTILQLIPLFFERETEQREAVFILSVPLEEDPDTTVNRELGLRLTTLSHGDSPDFWYFAGVVRVREREIEVEGHITYKRGHCTGWVNLPASAKSAPRSLPKD